VRRCDGNVGMQRAVYKKAQGHSRTPTEGRKYPVAFAIPLAGMRAAPMATHSTPSGPLRRVRACERAARKLRVACYVGVRSPSALSPACLLGAHGVTSAGMEQQPHAVEVAVPCRQDLQRPEHCGAVADSRDGGRQTRPRSAPAAVIRRSIARVSTTLWTFLTGGGVLPGGG
jgi:hypothetical protein